MQLAVDANVLLAASLGCNTHRIFLKRTGRFHDKLRRIRGRRTRTFDGRQTRSVADHHGRIISEPSHYRHSAAFAHRLKEAAVRIGHRDPDDIALVALALALDIPLWSNDRHFKNLGVELWTTSAIMELDKP